MNDDEFFQELEARKYLEKIDKCIKSGYCDIYCKKGKATKAAYKIWKEGIPDNPHTRIRRYEQMKGQCRLL